ncbi:hypothetical protein ACFL27_08675 [candidate division CSSED10-310 bacterium]|uniref:Cytochrome C n=1 Tax=candidate division CSSED10-310 bacterium TaxID=2855610 RepID=A0ABV6YVL8_UNCC1
MVHFIKKSRLFIVLLSIVLLPSVTSFGQTDTQGRGKLYQLMIVNMVDFQKVVVALSQSRWDDAYQEIEKQNTFSDQILELYPKKTIINIREYKKTAREIRRHTEKFQKYVKDRSIKRAHQEFSSLFYLCLSCHADFRD